jgi:hypothetical protein
MDGHAWDFCMSAGVENNSREVDQRVKHGRYPAFTASPGFVAVEVAGYLDLVPPKPPGVVCDHPEPDVEQARSLGDLGQAAVCPKRGLDLADPHD